MLEYLNKGASIMLPVIIEIHQALLKANYSEEEADNLVTRLMEEEAFDFVDCINSYIENNADKSQLN